MASDGSSSGVVTPANLENSKDIGKVAARVSAIETDVRSIKEDVTTLVTMMEVAQRHDDVMCTVAVAGRWAIRTLTWVLGMTISISGLILTYLIATGELAPP